ncbi:MAG: hypothetical protein A2075_12200 [Geobacteraceae bacterium GWC2_58_44]|nr:MAG: hypothetical protein A2075_12200 [Geobacteraceae bacterium GWC2_58_44]HBG06324.1 hypothetical protein [Geobacter sp.]
MLVETQEAIIQALTELNVFRHLDGWQGNIEELIKVPTKLPSAHVALGEIIYGEEPAAIGSKLSLDDMVWNVIITASNVRDRKSGAVECYSLIESSADKLKMMKIADGWLWPEGAKLLYAKNGLSVYGLSLRIETEQ